MLCANPNCRAPADQLLEGTLTMMEFETSPNDRMFYSQGGFPVFAARTRYFWLCAACSREFTITKWNSRGLILDRLPQGDASPVSMIDKKAASSGEPDRVNRPERRYGTA